MKTVIQRGNFIVCSCALLVSAYCLAGVAPVKADFPKPIAPPKSKSIAPIGQSSAVTLPAETTLVEAVHRHVPVLIEQMLNNQLTPQKAWEQKLLNVDDLLWIFTSYIDPWGSFNWKFDVGVRRGLAHLLIENGAEKLQPLEKLSPNARLWLADYYMSIADERTAPIGEGILQEIKAKVPDEDALAFQTIERIARYYAAKGEPAKGAQTWLRITDYYTDKNRFIPDALLEAAQLYMWSGEEEKANHLYDQVPQYGNGWFTGIGLIDQAEGLLRQGKHADALKLLQKAVTGQDAEQIRPAMLSNLAHSYYLIGDFAQARHYSQEAINQYNSLRNPRQEAGLEAIVPESEKRLQWIERWTKEPIIVAPGKLSVSVNEDETKELITRRLSIRTFREVPLSVVAERPDIQAYIEDKEVIQPSFRVEPKSYYVERKLVISLAPSALRKSFDTIITVQSPAFPNSHVQVPVHFTAHNLPEP